MTESRRRALILAGGAVAAAAAGIAVNSLLRSPDGDATLANLWALPLQDLEGRNQALTQWRGKVLVLNFWATWCEPCREEVPTLVEAQAQLAANGLQIVGIALDSAAKVSTFGKEFKVQYPLLIASLDAVEITRKLGNKAAGLPYTVVLDKAGRISKTHLGGISRAQLDGAVRPLLGT